VVKLELSGSVWGGQGDCNIHLQERDKEFKVPQYICRSNVSSSEKRPAIFFLKVKAYIRKLLGQRDPYVQTK